MYAKPALVDIEADGDLDLFVGERYSGVDFIRNDGDQTHPQWTFVEKSIVDLKEAYYAPAFCDIDADGDHDAFIGDGDGNIHFFRNSGDNTSPRWTLETDMLDSIDVKYHTTPVFCDIDADDDLDMFIGTSEGNVRFYENQGTPASHSFALADTYFVTAVPGQCGAPAFTDIDNDNDFDIFCRVTTKSLFLSK
jgi:hypothetical protein